MRGSQWKPEPIIGGSTSRVNSFFALHPGPSSYSYSSFDPAFNVSGKPPPPEYEHGYRPFGAEYECCDRSTGGREIGMVSPESVPGIGATLSNSFNFLACLK
jgi:hypothetical protein